ncbi:MAG: carbonate dehydratase [Pyrinomonadaceae bacterium]
MSDLKHLLEQNKIWAKRIKEEDPRFFENSARMQSPEYLWIGCSDSRITPDASLNMQPGEMFVHRNIANLVIPNDINCLAVMQYAVEVLNVRHIIICGHYGCGGVKAAYDPSTLGPIENWLSYVRTLMRKHHYEIESITDENERLDRICEINVIEQIIGTGETTIITEAWRRGQAITVHGWIYLVAEGIYNDLNFSIKSAEDLDVLREQMRPRENSVGI